MNDYSIDGMIRYFEMAHKVMGWTSTENSYEYHVAQMLKKLRDERDDARMLYCEFVAQDHREGYVDHPEQTPQDVAKSMGWEGISFVGWDDVKTTQYWCDDCGDAIEVANVFFYAELPCDITSANKGESATVCRKCNERIEADCCNSEYRTSH